MNWFKKDRGPRVDPTKISEQADATIEKVENQKEHVNFINSWLDARYLKNGLGEDFEWTLNDKRGKPHEA